MSERLENDIRRYIEGELASAEIGQNENEMQRLLFASRLCLCVRVERNENTSLLHKPMMQLRRCTLLLCNDLLLCSEDFHEAEERKKKNSSQIVTNSCKSQSRVYARISRRATSLALITRSLPTRQLSFEFLSAC